MLGHSNQVVKAHEVIDVNVVNSANENLGKITEIMLDKNTGQTSYVVLTCSGLLGLDKKLYALPWSELHYSKDKDCFTVNLNERALELAKFDKNNWPNEPRTLH